jgi:hypothetical protein
MKHVGIALAAFVIHTPLTALLSISYNPLTEPFDLLKLLLDLALFAAVYMGVWFVAAHAFRLGGER